MPMFEVSIRFHGRPVVKRGPAEGLLDWPRSLWKRITPRPLGLKRAMALANAQGQHAAVNVWQTAEKVYDNGKLPAVPEGWRHASEERA